MHSTRAPMPPTSTSAHVGGTSAPQTCTHAPNLRPRQVGGTNAPQTCTHAPNLRPRQVGGTNAPHAGTHTPHLRQPPRWGHQRHADVQLSPELPTAHDPWAPTPYTRTSW